MRTLKELKSVTIWNCIFCFSCILSTVCLVIDEYCEVNKLFNIGMLAVCGWMVNPFAIISCYRCLKVFLMERKNPDHNKIIGRKWVWIFIWPVVTTILWVLGGLLFVNYTGGV